MNCTTCRALLHLPASQQSGLCVTCRTGDMSLALMDEKAEREYESRTEALFYPAF